MTEKVLLVGNGAREHVMAQSLVNSGVELYSLGTLTNPGIKKISKTYVNGDFRKTSFLRRNFKKVDYACIGPEAPLAYGLADVLENELQIPVIGPRKCVAKIESSKIFTRKLLEEYNIPGNPIFNICTTEEEIVNKIEESENLVVKPDGLTGGKGVKIAGEQLKTKEEIKNYASSIIKQEGRVLIEEKLIGQEFSLQGFSDGQNIEVMPLVQDFKRAFDNNRGPNTGSMGSYSCPNHSLPFINSNIISKAKLIMERTIHALKSKTGCFYKGILYGQFLLNNQDLFLIEFNCRFGDPEAMNVLELLQTDFNSICHGILNNNIVKPVFEKKATTCVYVVPKGYPINPLKDQELKIKSLNNGVRHYFASVYEENKKIYSTGSRAIALIGKGDSVSESREMVYNALSKNLVSGEIYYRSDIAKNIT